MLHRHANGKYKRAEVVTHNAMRPYQHLTNKQLFDLEQMVVRLATTGKFAGKATHDPNFLATFKTKVAVEKANRNLI